MVAVLTAALSILLAGPAAGAEPVRIGFMAPLSGIFAHAGKDVLDGLKLGLEQSGGGVSVLDVQPGRVSQDARVRPQLPAGQASSSATVEVFGGIA
jgi:hypothetical protein